MEVKKFYRTQREVAAVINEIVDDYWVDKLSDEELEENVKMIYENNQDKIIKNKYDLNMTIILNYIFFLS